MSATTRCQTTTIDDGFNILRISGLSSTAGCQKKVLHRIPGKGVRRLGAVDQKSRQRLECVCLQHRFPFAAARHDSHHGSLCPGAKAPVKPDALHTLARATCHQTCPPSSVHSGIP
jgi:hypothetical protein